jgi:hypothetical protein
VKGRWREIEIEREKERIKQNKTTKKASNSKLKRKKQILYLFLSEGIRDAFATLTARKERLALAKSYLNLEGDSIRFDLIVFDLIRFNHRADQIATNFCISVFFVMVIRKKRSI